MIGGANYFLCYIFLFPLSPHNLLCSSPSIVRIDELRLLSYPGPKPGTLYVFAVFIFNITLKMLLGVNAGEGLLTRPQILKRLYFSLLFPC